MIPLGLLNDGEKAVIIKVRTKLGNSDKKLFCHIEDVGFRVGKIIQMLKNNEKGPILVKLDESRIAVGRGMAMKIFVRKI